MSAIARVVQQSRVIVVGKNVSRVSCTTGLLGGIN